MSYKYPCVYYDNGKCQNFSDDHYTAWCDFDQCEHITPSNGDRIRSMSDEELAEFLRGVYDDESCGVYQDECGKFICGITIIDYDQYKIADWLKQPYEEDT